MALSSENVRLFYRGVSAAANKVMDFVNAGKNQRIAQLLYATSPEQKSILAREVLK